VLEYNTPLTSSAPNRVFGQNGSFTTNLPNLGNGCNQAPSDQSLCAPQGVAVDAAGNLYIADGQYNNRVLEYDLPKGSCDLEITKTASPNPVPSGGLLTVSLSVKNIGTGPCKGVTQVNDGPDPWLTGAPVLAGGSGWNCSVATGTTVSCTWDGPTGTQPIPVLAQQQLPKITITGNVTAPPGSSVTNCATVDNPNDPNLPSNLTSANNQSCVKIVVQPTTAPPTPTITPTPTSSCANPTSGTAEAWWPLNETGGTTVTDISGNGHNGTAFPGPIGPILTATGPAAVSGKVGGALKFFGQAPNHRFVSVLSSQNILPVSDFSIDAWVLITQYNGGSIQPIVEKMQYNGTTPVLGYRFYLANGVLTFDAFGSPYNASTDVGIANQLTQNVWHHVAVTYSRGFIDVASFYIDGTPAGNPQNLLISGSLSNNADLIIGGSLLGASASYLNISIDEPQFFNSVLSPLDIHSIYKASPAGKCTPTPTPTATPTPTCAITVKKVAPGGGLQGFTFGSNVPALQSITLTDQQTSTTGPATCGNSYYVFESPLPNWAVKDITCMGPSTSIIYTGASVGTGMFDHGDGQAIISGLTGLVTCTFTNNQCGDVNKDGTVDAVDALLILQHIAKNPNTPPVIPVLNQPFADVSAPVGIDSIDALRVLQKIAYGKPPTPNAPPPLTC
jgi:hypothetical protein